MEESFETFHLSIQRMVWDESQQKYSYNVIEDSYSEYSDTWNITLYNDGTGEITSEDPGGEIGSYTVYQWQLGKSGQQDIISCKVIYEKYSTEYIGTKGTLYIMTNENGIEIGFYEPEKELRYVHNNIRS